MFTMCLTPQLWAGLPHPILEDTQPCPWIPTHWLSHLCTTMHHNHTQICYNSWTVLPLCQQDRYLMEDCADQNYLTLKLEQLNACRMYLQVTTLAEISDHMGTELLPQAFPRSTQLSPTSVDTISMSLLQWPQVATPLSACWRIWSNTIHTLYTGSQNGTRLQRLLGAWLPTYAQQRFWKWRMHDPEHLLFQYSPTTPTRVGLKTQQCCTMLKFSPMIPTTIKFTGPPVMPIDTTTGYI